MLGSLLSVCHFAFLPVTLPFCLSCVFPPVVLLVILFLAFLSSCHFLSLFVCQFSFLLPSAYLQPLPALLLFGLPPTLIVIFIFLKTLIVLLFLLSLYPSFCCSLYHCLSVCHSVFLNVFLSVYFCVIWPLVILPTTSIFGLSLCRSA